MKYSIIIPCYNHLGQTISCIQSVRSHSRVFELILVDDGSTDGTVDWMKHACSAHPNTYAFFHDQNMGFAHAVNTGIQASSGDFIVILNNDTIVTPGWLDSLRETFSKSEKDFSLDKVGMVGPVSNYAGGEQGIPSDKYTLEQLDNACAEHRKTYKDGYTFTGFLSGFCVMIRREVINDIGLFDTRYPRGFWEDNDYCLRAQLAGWHLVIDRSTFIHHHGSVTFRGLPINSNLLLRSNQLKFYEKYFNDDPKKLITVIRTRNDAVNLKKALTNASSFSDEIILLFDRCTDGSQSLVKLFPKVVESIAFDDHLDESRDRQRLLDAAVSHGADWVLSMDSDEILESSFTYDYAHKLMSPIDPQVFGYGFNFRTFFLGDTHFRTDGVFGSFWGIRFWRVFKNQKIQSSGHSGLHCTHGPPIPQFNLRRLRIRFKHYGYDSPSKCAAKHDFYTSLDPDPDRFKTSPDGYDHIISKNISLSRWVETNDITLCMLVHNEDANLFSFLSRYSVYFDDIVVVDTRSSDKTREVAELFGARVFTYKWRDSFADARNFCIKQCRTRWIFSMDPDEEIFEKDIPTIWDMIEENTHGWLFKFINFQKDGTVVYSDNVRLFRNIPELYWSWRCHENMAPSITKNKLNILAAPFPIRHYGFLKTGGSHNRKLIQYGKLLQKQIKEHPNEPLGYFHLAFHYFEEGHDQKGLEYLKKSIALKDEFFLGHKELGLLYLKKAQSYISSASEKTPEGHYYFKWLASIKKSIDSIINQPLVE